MYACPHCVCIYETFGGCVVSVEKHADRMLQLNGHQRSVFLNACFDEHVANCLYRFP